MKKHDVVIIGAGIIGLSIAWQLARRSRLNICVVEKGAAVGEGSTGASSAICRCRYSSIEMVNLARDGIDAYRHWSDFTRLDRPVAEFHQEGVLWMPGHDHEWADREHARMQQLGIATEVLDHAETEKSFPALSTCTIAPDLVTGEGHDCDRGGRNLLETEGGYFDPVGAAQDLVQACRGAGVDLRFRIRVSGLEIRGGQVSAVVTDGGDRLEAPVVVNAAGPWCNEINRMAGLQIPWELTPVRIQVLYLDRPESLAGHIPVTVDMTGGIYFRTQSRGQQLVVSSVLEEDETEIVANPDRFSLVHDDDFAAVKLHALHHRLPTLPYRSDIRGYCGLYTVNQQDVHPVIGETEITGLWLANGFSGHGFKLAPAIGAMVARAMTGERSDFDTGVPADFLAIGRKPIPTDSKSVLA